MGVGKWGRLWPHPVAFRPCFSPVELSGLSPAGRLISVGTAADKKGGVSNCFVPMFLCQRGLNSSLQSSDSAAKGGQRSIGAKQ